MAKTKKHIDWAAVEREFRKTDTSIRELAGWYEVDEAAIRYRARKGGWARPIAAASTVTPQPAPAPIVILRDPTPVTADNSSPADIVGRGRNLAIRMLDALDAATALPGEMRAAIEAAVGDPDRAREVADRALSLKGRSDVLKTLALAAKTLGEALDVAPEGKKVQRQAGAEKASSQGRFAVPQPPRAPMQ